LLELSVVHGKKIQPQTTLVIFDEIQACPRALTALKYFCEEKPEFAIVAAGSLLGITLSTPGTSFPVGKVSFLELNPCGFDEYLRTIDNGLQEYCESLQKPEPLSLAICDKLEQHFREYLVLGGMPAVLSNFIENQDVQQAEAIQQGIIQSYEMDFSKHAPHKDMPKLFLLWKSIPEQLARENAKFIYGEVKTGARAKDLEDALRWQLEAGLIQKVNRLEKPEIPLAAYEDRKSFKVYLSDTGLLRNLAKVPASSVLIDNDVFGDFKGRLVENYVLQQLTALGNAPVYYWSSGNLAEVDFVIQQDRDIIPIEVKSGLNVRSRSLKAYRDKYQPPYAIRFSLQNLKLDNGLLNIPLYLIGQYRQFIS
jgi:predicted AAA+ superfamily ATPase